MRRLLSDRRFRQRENAFVIEGTRWLAEMVSFKERLQLVLVTEQWLQGNRHLLETLNVDESSGLQVVTEQVIAHASDTETPSGVLGVVEIVPLPLPEPPQWLLILDRVADPGNMGTILRTSAAAGVDGVLAGPGCVDVYNPKVVRSSMGAHLRLPVLSLSWQEIEDKVAGMAVWVAAADGRTSYSEVDWKRPSALIIGSEARGAGQKAYTLAHESVNIPMAGETESLNAAVAAGVILFEGQRQRRS
ncbi:MAG: RNA methyltransferase [Candidatus Promineifilaceae bacterium]